MNDFPLIIENDTDIRDLTGMQGWLDETIPALKSSLDRVGAILFRGFPVASAEDFDTFARTFGYGEFTYAESLSNAVRINLTPRVFTANEAPPEVEIYLHHEMAQTPVSPDKIFFCCLAAAEQGGATPLCRSDRLYAAFRAAHPDWAAKFAELGLRYTTHMPASDDFESGQGRSWRSTLSVETIEAAEAKLRLLDYTWRWQPDGSLVVTTCALPAVRHLPDGSESFYNQLIAAWRGWRKETHPVVTFGNGEVIPEDAVGSIVDLADQFIVPAAWQDGDIALIDNHRVMHGRYPYGGGRKRRVLVCLARDEGIKREGKL
ncbi:MAG TPA: TauD/TfdA family dioxygenase [Pseudomonadales bacterium]|nr:TauD/TfdA family dioxygenase [Pseudomonadales bacterium]